VDAPFETPQYVGLLGHPVAENPTGAMQEAAFAEAGLPWRYLSFDVLPDRLGSAVQALRVLGFRGANCTIPHKVSVLPYLDEVAADAARIGAVNTIRRDGERLIGENTDGKGFIRALTEDGGIDPEGKSFLLLGAGGAARAVAFELAARRAGSIILVNRSRERGAALADDLAGRAGFAAALWAWTGPVGVPEHVDVLVNCTSIGLHPRVEQMPAVDLGTLRSGLLVCDIIPNPPATRLLHEARRRGCRTLDGLGMLVYQGAIGFEMWTGRRPSVALMRQALERVFEVTATARASAPRPGAPSTS